MKWKLGRRSSNVEDRRGIGAAGVGGLGIGGLLIVGVIAMLMGQDPAQVIGQMTSAGSPDGQGQSAPVDDESSQFIGAVLGSTEDMWSAEFKEGGSQYPAPKLVMFSGSVSSACGRASAAGARSTAPATRGLPRHQFFDQMKTQLGGGGDFAQAYVIATKWAITYRPSPDVEKVEACAPVARAWKATMA